MVPVARFNLNLNIRSSCPRAGRRLGVVGVDGGRLVPVDGGLPVDVVPAAVAERIVSEHRPRIVSAGVTADGVEWSWFYS